MDSISISTSAVIIVLLIIGTLTFIQFWQKQKRRNYRNSLSDQNSPESISPITIQQYPVQPNWFDPLSNPQPPLVPLVVPSPDINPWFSTSPWFNTFQSDIIQKQQKILNIQNISFHYADEAEIRRLYRDYFKGNEISEITSETAEDSKSNIGVNTVIIGGTGVSDSSKVITKEIPYAISVPEMFRKFQSEMVKKWQVWLYAEFIDIDPQQISNFDYVIMIMKEQGFALSDEQKIDITREKFRAKSAERTLLQLEALQGQVIVNAKFKITEHSEHYYKFAFLHPINDYLPAESNKVAITFMLKKDLIEPSLVGNYLSLIGKSVPLWVYGNVLLPLSRKEDIWEIMIKPIAVY